jgi:hypothetical protein
MSSRYREGRWKRVVLVIEPTGLEAVVELAEELVEQVSLGLVVPVAFGAAGVEVAACAGRGPQRRQCPDRADRGQSFVFDVSVQDDFFAAAGAGDRGGPGVGFEAARVAETCSVVSDFGEHPGTCQCPESREAGDDRGVRVPVKMVGRRLGELLGGRACGVEQPQQRGQLQAHGVLHQLRLPQSPFGAEHGVEAFDLVVGLPWSAAW